MKSARKMWRPMMAAVLGVLLLAGLVAPAGAARSLQVGSRVRTAVQIESTSGFMKLGDINGEVRAEIEFDLVTRDGRTGSGVGEVVIDVSASGLLGRFDGEPARVLARSRQVLVVTEVYEGGFSATGTGTVTTGCIEVAGEVYRIGSGGPTRWLPPICRTAPVAGPAILEIGGAATQDTDD